MNGVIDRLRELFSRGGKKVSATEEPPQQPEPAPEPGTDIEHDEVQEGAPPDAVEGPEPLDEPTHDDLPEDEDDGDEEL